MSKKLKSIEMPIGIAMLLMFFISLAFTSTAFAESKPEPKPVAKNCEDILDNNKYHCVVVSSVGKKPFDSLFEFTSPSKKNKHFDLRVDRRIAATCECKAKEKRGKIVFNATDEFHCVTNDRKDAISWEGLAEKEPRGQKWDTSIEKGQAVNYKGVSFWYECEEVDKKYADNMKPHKPKPGVKGDKTDGWR